MKHIYEYTYVPKHSRYDTSNLIPHLRIKTLRIFMLDEEVANNVTRCRHLNFIAKLILFLFHCQTMFSMRIIRSTYNASNIYMIYCFFHVSSRGVGYS